MRLALTIISLFMVLPTVFLINALCWWTIGSLMAAVFNFIYAVFEEHNMKPVGKYFVADLLKPITNSISAVKTVRCLINKAFVQ